MIVYRFEKNGIGPYVNGTNMTVGSFFRSRAETRTEKKYAHIFNQYVIKIDSTIRQEMWNKAHGNKKYMFGCSSKEQLKAYFNGNFKILFKEGFRIKRYKVPDDEVIDMGVEVAFPVRYHKLQTVKAIEEKTLR